MYKLARATTERWISIGKQLESAADNVSASISETVEDFLGRYRFLEKPSEQRQHALSPWVQSKSRDGIRQRRLRREQLENNPMAWLADRDRPRRRWVWCFPALTIGLWMGFKLDPLGNPAAQAGFVAFVAIHVFFKIWLRR